MFNLIALDVRPPQPSAQILNIRNDPAFGLWLTEDRDALVRIAPCVAKPRDLCGVIEKVLDPDAGSAGPSTTLQLNQFIGMKVLYGFSKASRSWVGGNAFDPDEDKTYSDLTITVVGRDKLLLSKSFFYLRVSSQTWTRVGP